MEMLLDDHKCLYNLQFACDQELRASFKGGIWKPRTRDEYAKKPNIYVWNKMRSK